MPRHPLLLTSLALFTLSMTVAPAAVAAPPEEEPHSTMRLTLSGSDTDISWIRWVELTCPGDDTRHPDAAAACAALELAGGEPRLLAGSGDTWCTTRYDPVTASANGTWHGRPVSWHETFPNACVLRARTGLVFAF